MSDQSHGLLVSPSQLFDVSASKLSEMVERSRARSQAVAAKAKGLAVGQEGAHLREKLAFVLGVANIFVTAMCLTLGVQAYALWYSLKWVVMISARIVQYRKRLYHYFLFDFCYYGNLIMLAYIWLLPHSSTLFLVAFAFANGPLAFAVPLWKNALVFHSLDKLTSCFIHLSPGFMSWSLLWMSRSDPWFVEQGFRICGLNDPECPAASALDFFYYGMPAYALWQLLYLLRVELVGSAKVKERGYLTSRIYMSKKGFIAILVNRWPSLKGRELLLFVLFQFFYTLATLLPATLAYHSRVAHTALLSVVALWAAWNGSDFYFQVMRAQAERVIVAKLEAQKASQ